MSPRVDSTMLLLSLDLNHRGEAFGIQSITLLPDILLPESGLLDSKQATIDGSGDLVNDLNLLLLPHFIYLYTFFFEC